MHFYIYKASAGSGKTYTLVKEYLKMALINDDSYRFRRILAITFTNKAAAEMKERVIHVLHVLSFQQLLCW
jgi:superfamily I DNA/RNA helicase